MHPDLVGELSCHHWMARPPRLPLIAGAAREAADSEPQQLSLRAAGAEI
jgi:hypothetical protein